MAGLLVRSVLLLIVSGGVGLSVAAVRGLPWVPDLKAVAEQQERRQAVQSRHAELRAKNAITLEDFRAFVEGGAGVVIDARTAADFEKGHVLNTGWPPTLNIEPQNVRAQMDRLMQLVGREIVIYCNSETCDLAEQLLVELEGLGLGFDASQVRIFFPGWDGVLRAGLATTSGPDTWAGDFVDGG